MNHLKPIRNARQSTRPRSGNLNTSGTMERFSLTTSSNALSSGGGGGLSSSVILTPTASAGVVEALDRVSILSETLGSPPSSLPSLLLQKYSFTKIDQNLEVISKRFNTLADRALLILRSEFRLHCLFYLEGLKRTSCIRVASFLLLSSFFLFRLAIIDQLRRGRGVTTRTRRLHF